MRRKKTNLEGQLRLPFLEDQVEEWRDIQGYEGIYQASNLGRVKSIDRIDNIGKHRKGRIMKLNSNSNGYLVVSLYKNGVLKTRSVHRLVFEAFNGPITEGMQVNHINEDKTDNRLENLNLLTPKENVNWGTAIERIRDKLINGKKSKPVSQYNKDGKLINTYPSIAEAYRQTGINSGNITTCCIGRGRQSSAGGFIWKYA